MQKKERETVKLRNYKFFLKVEQEMKGIKFEIFKYIIINWKSVNHFAHAKKKYMRNFCKSMKSINIFFMQTKWQCIGLADQIRPSILGKHICFGLMWVILRWLQSRTLIFENAAKALEVEKKIRLNFIPGPKWMRQILFIW